MMGLSGLEPPTSRLSGVRSNQLSYRPIVENGAGDGNRTHDNSLEGCSFTTKLHPQSNIILGRLVGIEPTSVGATIRCVNHFAIAAIPHRFKWWLRTESNRRHKDFQSFALPTELLSRKLWFTLSFESLRPLPRPSRLS